MRPAQEAAAELGDDGEDDGLAPVSDDDFDADSDGFVSLAFDSEPEPEPESDDGVVVAADAEGDLAPERLSVL